MNNYYYSIIVLLAFLVSSCSTKEPETTITLNHQEITIKPSDVLVLEYTISPATTETVVWASSDITVAKVEAGMVQPQKASGTAIITATVGNASAQCIVTIAQTDYELVWEDEFLGSTLNTNNWVVETGGNGWGNYELQYYTDRSSNLRLEDGVLIIQALKEDYSTKNYTSARITTKDKQAFEYGKIEAKISLPSGQGTWPAFWMLGYGNWPYCGEIDIMEHTGANPGSVSHALHTSKKNGNKGNQWNSTYSKLSDIENNYHIYGIEWEKNILLGRDAIKFTVDGVQSALVYEESVIKDQASWPFYKEFYIIINLAIGGRMGGEVDVNIFNNDVIMKIDWIKVYQRP